MVHWRALTVFIILFALITGLGFFAARWRKSDLGTLEQWGLGGRTFGIAITWFLLGGDLYTAYTLIAVPALVFGKGAIGFFALPYTIIVYPLMLLVMPKLWQIAKDRGHVTPSDYVKERFDSPFLALLVAITGIVATMPYIALQMYGIEVVLAFMGVPPEGALIGAFSILALFTYVSGLRAPALISLVKDILIYATFITAVIYIPIELGGFGNIFSHVPPSKVILQPSQYAGYSSLVLGSALALFLYPHALTGILCAQGQHIVKRNMSMLPAYTFLLGVIALLGYMAIAAGLSADGAYGANGIVPKLFMKMFPDSFVGFAFGAIAIGALVPASVMSIAAANLFSRNIYREFFRRGASPSEEATVAKVASLVVKLGALGFILGVPTDFVINFQLAGGVWILQTLPAIFLALYVGWLDRSAIIAGWSVGIAWGSYQLVQEGFSSSLHALAFLGGLKIYIAVSALIANLVVLFIGTTLARLLGAPRPCARFSDPEHGDKPRYS